MAMNDDYYIQLPSKHRIFSYLPAVAIGNLYIYIYIISYIIQVRTYLCIGTIIYKITAVTIYFNFFFPLEEYCTRYVQCT